MLPKTNDLPCLAEMSALGNHNFIQKCKAIAFENPNSRGKGRLCPVLSAKNTGFSKKSLFCCQKVIAFSFWQKWGFMVNQNFKQASKAIAFENPNFRQRGSLYPLLSAKNIGVLLSKTNSVSFLAEMKGLRALWF